MPNPSNLKKELVEDGTGVAEQACRACLAIAAAEVALFWHYSWLRFK